MFQLLSRGHCTRAAFKLPYLLVEVFVKVAFDEAGVGLLQLVLVEVHKYDSNVVEEFINPRDM